MEKTLKRRLFMISIKNLLQLMKYIKQMNFILLYSDNFYFNNILHLEGCHGMKIFVFKIFITLKKIFFYPDTGSIRIIFNRIIIRIKTAISGYLKKKIYPGPSGYIRLRIETLQESFIFILIFINFTSLT